MWVTIFLSALIALAKLIEFTADDPKVKRNAKAFEICMIFALLGFNASKL
jgi:hypothetical protein